MCTILRSPCGLLEREKGWPEFLNCQKDFPHRCKVNNSFCDYIWKWLIFFINSNYIVTDNFKNIKFQQDRTLHLSIN